MAQTAGMHGGGKSKGGVWRVVFVIALIVFICSVAALAIIGYSYFQGQQKYDKITETASFDPGDRSGLDTLSVNWDALKAVNPDTVGWVYIPNTVINYPIVQAGDNDYYLSHDFDGDEGWLADFGSVFLDYRNNPEWTDASSFVYGHHLNDGSMFAALGEMRDQARFEECRTVYLLTPQGNYKLRAYSLVHCAGTEALVRTEFDDAEDMRAYVQEMIDRSEFDPGTIPEASKITKSFAFATCDDTYQSTGRYVLFCYIEQTNANDLSGQIDTVSNEEGQTDGLANTIITNQ